MRAISLHQPHAAFVAHGYKPFETRGWATNYRGPLLIHAAAKPMSEADRRLAELVFGPKFPMIHYGAIVAVTNLLEIYDAADIFEHRRDFTNKLGNFAAGRFAWELTSIRRLANPIVTPAGNASGMYPSSNGRAKKSRGGPSPSKYSSTYRQSGYDPNPIHSPSCPSCQKVPFAPPRLCAFALK